jgi:hypothetical protein
MSEFTAKRQLAQALLAMTWEEMDDFAERCLTASRDADDNGDGDGVRYVAQCLLDTATEIMNEGEDQS